MQVKIILPLAIACLLGILWRFFSRASKAFRSKLRAYPSRWDFVKANWDVFLLRTFPFNASLFYLWVLYPGLLSKIVVGVGVPANLGNWLTVPPTLGTSFGFGFAVDYLLDQIQIKIATSPTFAWLPDAFKGEIPNYDQQAVNGQVIVQSNQRDAGFGTDKTTEAQQPPPPGNQP